MDAKLRGLMDDVARAKQRGDLHGALATVEIVLRDWPEYVTGHGQKAHILHLLKQTKQGLQWLSDHRPAQGYPDYIEAIEAELLWALKRKDEARFFVDRLVPRGGLTDAAVRRLAELLVKMKDKARARDMVARWVPTTQDRKAALLLQATLEDNPAPLLRQLLQDYPDDAALFEKVTRLRLEALTPEEAVAELQVLISTSKGSDSASLRRMLGTALRHAGQPEAALAEFQRCLAAEPKNTFYRSQMAVCLSDLERYAEALDAMEDVVRSQPHKAVYRSSLYACYRKAGEAQRAGEFTQAMVAHKPELAGAFWSAMRSVK